MINMERSGLWQIHVRERAAAGAAERAWRVQCFVCKVTPDAWLPTSYEASDAAYAAGFRYLGELHGWNCAKCYLSAAQPL